MRLSISKKIWVPTTIAMILAAVTYGALTDETYFGVKSMRADIQPSTLHKSVQDEVHQRALMRLNAIQGKNIWQVSLQKLRENILSDVWVDSVSIEREMPDSLYLRVKIKNVILVYIDARGRIVPISEKAQLLSPIELSQMPDVPVIRNAAVVKDLEVLAKVVELYQSLPESGVLSRQTIAEIDWSRASGMSVELTKSDAGKIILGTDGVAGKAKRVTNVLKYLESQKQKWRVIDASFSKKVLVRLRKHS